MYIGSQAACLKHVYCMLLFLYFPDTTHKGGRVTNHRSFPPSWLPIGGLESAAVGLLVLEVPCPDSQGANTPFDFRGHVPASRG